MDVVWSIEKDKLIPVLETLDLIPTRPGIPASQYVWLNWKDGKLHMAAASEVSGEVWLKGSGTFPKKSYFVDRRLFFPFLMAGKKMKSKSPFEFSMTGERLVIRQGKRKAFFDPLPVVSGYGVPTTGNGTELKFDQNLYDLIRCAKECATGDPSVPHLNCVYINPKKGGVDVLATNQIIIQQGLPTAKVLLDKALPFPLFLVNLLNNEHIKKIVWRQKEILLDFGHGTIWQTVSASATKDFPVKGIADRVEQSKTLPEAFRIDCHQLGIVVARLGVYLGAVRRQDWLLSITGQAGGTELVLEVKVPQGEFREKLKTSKPLASAVTVEWPLEFLLPIFDFIGRTEKGDLAVRYQETRKVVEKKGKKKTIINHSPYHLKSTHLHLVVARLVKSK
jgi:hypothetical protein